MDLVRRLTTWLALGAMLGVGFTVGRAIDGGNQETRLAADAHDATSSTTSTVAADEPDPETARSVEPAPDTTPPPLAITTPEHDARVSSKHLRFAGETEPGATVSAGPYAADVSDDGRWALVLVLSPGANPVTFVASDAAGNQSEASVTVHYDPPAPSPDACASTTGDCEKDHDACANTTGDCEPAIVSFAASQKYGSCDESPPYDVFYGTAPPGTAVTVTSPYGSGSTVAGEKGGWDLKVVFADAPPGQTFSVTVSGQGGTKVFSFVNTGGAQPV